MTYRGYEIMGYCRTFELWHLDDVGIPQTWFEDAGTEIEDYEVMSPAGNHYSAAPSIQRARRIIDQAIQEAVA